MLCSQKSWRKIYYYTKPVKGLQLGSINSNRSPCKPDPKKDGNGKTYDYPIKTIRNDEKISFILLIFNTFL